MSLPEGVSLELCNGTLSVQSYGIHPGEHRVMLTDRLAGKELSLRWEQWDDLRAALRGEET